MGKTFPIPSNRGGHQTREMTFSLYNKMKMDENKIKICNVLKKEIEGEVQGFEQLKQLESPKTILERNARLIERKTKIYQAYCNKK